MPHLVPDYLVQTSAVGMANALLGRLHWREARQVTRGTLGMHVLAIFESAVESCDQRDVLCVIGQRLHRRGEFQGIDAWIRLDSFLILRFVSVKAPHETG